MSIALYAFCAASIGSAAIGACLLPTLRRLGVRQTISEDAPDRHAAKQGTPTLGGMVILAGIGVGLLAAAPWVKMTAGTAMVGCLTLAFGLIGLLDDGLIVVRGKNLGLRARDKFALQLVVAAGFAAWLYLVRGVGPATSVAGVHLGWLYYPLCILLIAGLSNAANLSDGLDGLSAGMCMVVAIGAAAMLARSGNHESLMAFAMVVAGGCGGFLFFNVHPALVFMGDTGSLALGAALAGIAVVGKLEVPLQVASAVLWIETFSVIAQVTVFKWRRRTNGIEYARAHRLLRRAPLHHHLEELGCPETRVVGRLTLLTALSTAAALGAVCWRN